MQEKAGPIAVVGVGNTASLDAEPAVVMDEAAVAALGSSQAAQQGPNTVLLRLEEPTEANLTRAVADTRELLDGYGVTLTGFPEVNIDGAHPLAQEISMVAVMIGMLGAVAAMVRERRKSSPLSQLCVAFSHLRVGVSSLFVSTSLSQTRLLARKSWIFLAKSVYA